MQQKTGKFLYRSPAITGFVIVISIILILIDICLIGDWAFKHYWTGSLIAFFVFASFDDLKREAYYEHGIMQYRRGRAINFIPYEQIEKIRCSRTSGNNGGQSRYKLCFYHKGECVGLIITGDLKSIENTWSSILDANHSIDFLKKLTIGKSSGGVDERLGVVELDKLETTSGRLYKSLRNIAIEKSNEY